MPSPEATSSSGFCAERLKALADPTRLSVMRVLLGGPRHVSDLTAALGVEQSLLSHHLRVLREVGLLRAERDGKAVLYALAPGVEVAATGSALHLGCCQLSFDTPARRAAEEKA